MSKSIKGKECGKGIFQRKDGWYIARFVDKYGMRHEKYFKTIPEARNRHADCQYQNRHGPIAVPVNMTVDTWFDYWIQNIVGDLAPNTLRNYRERYKFLTIEDQKKFLEVAKRSHNYYQYALILETGLRTGEMIGLTWDAIDWENRTLTVNKTHAFRHKQKDWRAGPPKTQHSCRTIPLTNFAYEILQTVYENSKNQKRSEILSQELEYIDRHTGAKSKLVMNDHVFGRADQEQLL